MDETLLLIWRKILTEYYQTENRRQHPRVQAPLYCWPKRLAARSETDRLPLIDVSLGGMRVHLYQEVKMNDILEMELLLPDNTILQCTARVAWLSPLPIWASAKYDVGFQFVQMPTEALKCLARTLGQEAWLE